MGTTTTIYSHPDGHEIAVGNGLLTACTREGTALSIPIGHDGLAELGATLLRCARDAERLQCAKQAAEQAGATLGDDLMQELFALRGQPQAKAFCAVHAKLRALCKLQPHPDSAAGGFAAMVVNVLELGIANVPKFEEGVDE